MTDTTSTDLPPALQISLANLSDDEKATLDKYLRAIAHLQRDINAVTEKTKNANDELMRASAASSEMSQKLSTAEESLKRLEVERVQVKGDVNAAQERLAQVKAIKSDLESQLSALQAENDQLERLVQSTE